MTGRSELEDLKRRVTELERIVHPGPIPPSIEERVAALEAKVAEIDGPVTP